jgi:hypothetical protein
MMFAKHESQEFKTNKKNCVIVFEYLKQNL